MKNFAKTLSGYSKDMSGANAVSVEFRPGSENPWTGATPSLSEWQAGRTGKTVIGVNPRNCVKVLISRPNVPAGQVIGGHQSTRPGIQQIEKLASDAALDSLRIDYVPAGFCHREARWIVTATKGAAQSRVERDEMGDAISRALRDVRAA